MLPHLKDAAACSFLLRLLRAAHMFNCSVECRTELEVKAGQQLDQARLSDLLIPSFCHTSEYLYDVDLVRRLLDYFLALEHGSAPSGAKSKFFNKRMFDGLFGSKQAQAAAAPSAKLKAVTKLIDMYLAEVARDSKLPLEKFNSLAEAVPASARVSDDGLYRAVDTYLKIHTNLAEHEKKKLCRNLDCSRFSVAACQHAAQNERLPLRIVIQVLFGEQLKLRDAITGITQSILEDRAASAHVFGATTSPAEEASPDSVRMLLTTNQVEIRAMQQELTTMRMKYSELERSHCTMMDVVEKIVAKPTRRNAPSSWPWKSKPSSSKGDRSQASSPRKADVEAAASRQAPSSSHPRWRNSIT